MQPVVELINLEVQLRRHKKSFPVVRDVSLAVMPSEVLCVVGESGCGKSMMAMSIPRLLPTQAAQISSGHVLFEGKDLVTLSQRHLARIRGKAIGVVFQDPMSALNPVMRVEDQLAEALLIHQRLTSQEIAMRVDMSLEEVGISAKSGKKRAYPHELSGGQRQRVMLAMALIHGPRLLIADEPTTALDVTIQAQVLAVLESLQRQRQMGMLLITHDLGVVYQVATKVAVMYAGEVMEWASCDTLFSNPKHPYTQALQKVRESFEAIAGSVPDLAEPLSRCSFADRCPGATKECLAERPPLREVSKGHFVRCVWA